MNKTALLDKLERATNRAAFIAVDKCYPISIDRSTTRMGEITIRKNNNSYDIFLFEKLLFEGIFLFDVATIVAKKYINNDIGTIRKILALEEKFIKHSTDMAHYINCIKGAKKKNDLERVFILEDKFRLSEQMAKNVKDKIQILR